MYYRRKLNWKCQLGLSYRVWEVNVESPNASFTVPGGDLKTRMMMGRKETSALSPCVVVVVVMLLGVVVVK